MKRPGSEHRYYLGVLIVSFALNLIQNQLVVIPAHQLWADMGQYIAEAERIASGAPPATLDGFYPPGASVFYSLFFRILPRNLALQLASVVIALMLSLANVFLGLTTQLLTRSRVVGVGVALAASLYWPFSELGSYFLAEPLYIFLLLGAQLLFALGLQTTDRSVARVSMLAAGMSFAFAALVKSQALFTLASFLVLCFIFCKGYTRRLGPLIIGCAAVLLPYSFRHGSFEPKISNNDAYVFYLGQSRREGVGGVQPNGVEYYYFANNNYFSGFPFLPPQMLEVSLHDRAYFFREAFRFWHESPSRQLLRSAENLVELFIIRPSWPILNMEHLISYDLTAQWLGFVFFVLPALCTVVTGVLRRRLRMFMLMCVLPIVGIAVVAFLGTGQPRYLLPYYYNFIALAGPAYVRFLGVARSARLRRKVIVELIVASLFGAGIYFSGAQIRSAYARATPLPIDGRQEDYGALGSLSPQPDRAAPLYWFEAGGDGKNGRFGYERSMLPGAYVTQIGLTLFRRYDRAVPNTAETRQGATLKVFLPSRDITHVALYLTDPNSFRRIVMVRSSSERYLAQDLHNGRWVSMAVTSDEREKGLKEITLERLVGESAAVSAVLLYREQRQEGGA
ncbi:MAG: hypothetical protein U0136_03665 [Bdellovibrionota bacterium]